MLAREGDKKAWLMIYRNGHHKGTVSSSDARLYSASEVTVYLPQFKNHSHTSILNINFNKAILLYGHSNIKSNNINVVRDMWTAPKSVQCYIVAVTFSDSWLEPWIGRDI